MQYQVVELNEKIIGGLAVRTTNENMQAVKDIGSVWEQFMVQNIHEKLENRKNNEFVGLYTEYEEDHTKGYTFMAGCELQQEAAFDDPVVLKTIKAGKYAKFSFQGDVKEAVMKAWMEIWNMELNRTFESDFEVYHDVGDMSHTSIDIYVSIQ